MTNKTIAALTAATTPLAGTELVPVWDGSATKKVSVNNLTAGKEVIAYRFSVQNTNGAIPYAGYSSGAATALHTYTATPAFQLDCYQSTGGFPYTKTTDLVANADSGVPSTFRLLTVASGGSAPTEAMEVDINQNLKFTVGNLVQGTAAKGINFTANTPAAGMTSQLLNWYEEGTYTATISAGSGSFTNVTQALTYTRIGRIMHVDGKITIITNGTAGTNLSFTMPVASAANDVSFAGRENQSVGIVFGGASISTTTIAITKYDGTYLGGDSYVFPIHFAYKLG